MRRVVATALMVVSIFVSSFSLALADYPPRTPPGNGPIIIRNNMGGYVGAYGEWVNRILNSGRQVEIRGECASACTMILYIPKERICVSSRAQFSFHLEGDFTHWYRYPSEVQQWLQRQGGRGFGKRWAILKGRELLSIFRLCGS